MSENPLSTYEEFIQDPLQKDLLDQEYRELVLSELFLALMDEDQVSVRNLAKAAGISPTIIQELRTGKKNNLTLRTFLNLVKSLGYSLILEKTLHVPSVARKRAFKRRKIRFNLRDGAFHVPRRRRKKAIRISKSS